MNLLETSGWEGKIYSGGWIDGASGTYASIEPATGRELANVGTAAPSDLKRAVERAREAQSAWAATPYDTRASVLRRAADLLVEHQEEIEDWVVREAGLPRYFAGALGAAEEFQQAAALASAPLGQVLPSSQPRLSFTRRKPVGVVGVIAPFNAPVILAARALAPALAVGNAVVLKPDPRTAVCGGVVFARLLEEAGLPPDVLHVLPGGGEIGRELVTHPDVPVIAFTGSVDAGREVARLAAGLLKRVHLELGGNSALVVLADADLEQAVNAGSFGSFHNAGQVCMASSRHLVAAPLVEEYTALLAERAAKLRVGDPAVDDDVAYGPLIGQAARDRVHAILHDSVAAGARLVTGGGYQDLFYEPTVLADVPPQATRSRSTYASLMSTLGYAILGLLAAKPRTGYDLTRLMRAPIGYMWTAHHSQIYPELARLEGQGFVTATVIDGPGPRDTKRSITAAGRDALQDWVDSPLTPIQRSELMLRIRGLWLLPPERARAFLLTQREWYESRLATYAMEEAAFVLEGDAVDDPTSFVSAEYATLRFGIMHVPVTIAWLDWLIDRLDRLQPASGIAADKRDEAESPD